MTFEQPQFQLLRLPSHKQQGKTARRNQRPLSVQQCVELFAWVSF